MVQPEIGFILKVKSDNKKAFINVFHNNTISTFILTTNKKILDHNNNQCDCYSIVVPTDLYLQCINDKDLNAEVIIIISIISYSSLLSLSS